MHSIHATTEVLSLEGLSVTFATPAGEVAAVRDLSLRIGRGECVGIVGESGAGKSQAFLAVMGLLAANGRATGKALFAGTDLLKLQGAALDRIRGARIGMVFQDPMTSLTPHIPVGDQVAEPMVRHLGLSWREARAKALSLLQQVQVTDAPGASPGAAGIGHATSPIVWSETARDVRSTLPVFVTRKL